VQHENQMGMRRKMGALVDTASEQPRPPCTYVALRSGGAASA
jgi:hypothetical protein